MTQSYRILLDYAFQLTGDRDQAKAIVDYTLLEAVTISIETKNGDKASAFIVAEIRRLAYEYINNKNRNLSRGMKQIKRLQAALRYLGHLDNWEGYEHLTFLDRVYKRRFGLATAWRLAKVIYP